MVKALGILDTVLHKSWDWYINRQWLGWGTLQLLQWHVCQAYGVLEDREERRA